MTPACLCRLGVLLLLLLAGASPAHAAKLPPVDQAPENPSFQSFRARLLRAVEERDAAFVLSILHPEIKLSFGDDYGLKDFERIWEPENPESKLWPTLGRILSLGGAFYPGDEQRFCAPYVFSLWPDDVDPFDYAAIVAADVPARARPHASAPVVVTLSYDIVKLAEPDEFPGSNREWVGVQVLGRADAYVPAEAVYSPVGYRACFERENGRWVMAIFLAGD